MSLIATKIIVAILFGLIRFLAGFAPIKLYHFFKRWEQEEEASSFVNEKRHKQLNCGIALCQAFGGGVLFATCFLHMIPEVFRQVEALKQLGGYTSNYPISQLTVCLGFFVVYFVEEASSWFLTKIPDEPCRPKTTNKVTPRKENKPQVFIIDTNEDKGKRIDDVVDELNEEQLEETIPFDNLSVTSKSEPGKLQGEAKTKQQIMRGLLVLISLNLQAFFEGLSLGLQHRTSTIWYLFVAISIHSAIILFCVGVELILAKVGSVVFYVNVVVLALISPLGIFVGLLVTLNSNGDSASESMTVVLLEGLSTGTILYITFFEVLNREKLRRAYRIERGVCILGGFLLMALLQFIEF